MALHKGFQRRIDSGRGRSAIFAHDGNKLMRKGVRNIRNNLIEQLAEAQLVIGVGDRLQETDSHSFEAPMLDPLDNLAGLIFVERYRNCPLRANALFNFECVAPRDVRIRIIV